MNTAIFISCWAAIIWSTWRMPLLRMTIMLVAFAVLASNVKADTLPSAQMAILHYDKFRDTFMLAKCVEAGKASEEDFAVAYQLLVQRDPMAAKVTAAGGQALGMYLGESLSQDLMRVVNSFQFMHGSTLDTYCKYTAIRATTR